MESTATDPFSQIITTLLKPLIFASKDNFAHLSAIKNIAELTQNLCQQALRLSISDGTMRRVRELQNIFVGFDSMTVDQKKDKITKAMEIIEGLKVKGERSMIKTLTPNTLHLSPDFEEIKTRVSRLSTPLRALKGIGTKLAEVFRKKGLESAEDILYWLPIRYEDRRKIKKISQLRFGAKEVASGEIMVMGEVFYGRRKIFEMSIGDGSGFLRLKWFNYKLPFMKRRYKIGQRLIVYGEVGIFGGQKDIIHPDIEIIEDGDELDSLHFNAIVPIYSQIGNIHQKTLRKIIRNIVDEYSSQVVGPVPKDILKRYSLLDLSDAIAEVHRPNMTPPCPPLEKGGGGEFNLRDWLPRKSLIFDELFCLETGLALKKGNTEKKDGITFSINSKLVEDFVKILPFKLTAAQDRALSEIKRDMAMPHPMNRLIQGDVGSGKTVVAFIASLIAIENNCQSAIMAPTEILAEQHYLNIHGYAESLGIKVALLTSNLTKSERTTILNCIKNGDINLAIGTHALIQEDVEFNKLGLVIIDEQHRFGVVQRALLKKKGANPDILVMTATPIPRTLAMTVYGDLDVSVIDELPPGRKPVKTKVYREKDREQVYNIVKNELTQGRQAYIVYPIIEESEELDLKDATKMSEHLQKDIFPNYKVNLLHGRMKAEEKEKIMKAFKAQDINILVSTTVIEVGIDVPNATVMVIEHAERFGLSQLHQLRGRVGRGGYESYCILLAGRVGSLDTYQRLKVMEDTNDGFKIAEEDLKLRGPGDFLGTRQSGLPEFRVVNLLTDASLLQKAREEAFKMLKNDPNLTLKEHAGLKEIVKMRWKGRMELAEIG